MKPLEYDLQTDGVTQSLLMMFKECPTKAKHYLDGLTGRRPSVPIMYGSIMHSLLEDFHKKQTKTHRIPQKEEVVSRLAEIADAWKNENGKRWSVEEAQDFEITCAQIEAVAPAYFQFWAKHPLDWMDIEGSFRLKFGDTWLLGKWDAVYKSHGKLWLFDAKNKSRIEPDQLGEVLLRDFQINYYMTALRLMTGKMPAGFLYSVMRRPGLKLKKDENLRDHVKRIEEHIAEDPEHYFMRYEVAIDKDDLFRFEAELHRLLKQFKEWIKGGKEVDLYGQPCVNKYGLCGFVQKCYADNEAPYYRRKVLFSELEE